MWRYGGFIGLMGGWLDPLLYPVKRGYCFLFGHDNNWHEKCIWENGSMLTRCDHYARCPHSRWKQCYRCRAEKITPAKVQ